jgi:hypothetical protein
MNRDAPVLENQGVLPVIDRMEENLIPNIRIVSAHEEIEQVADLLRPVNMQFGSTSEQVHRTYETRQAINVVTMIVADEDVADIGHRESHQLHLCLSPFAAVYHEILAPHIQYLRGRLVALRGLCRAATEYV